MGIFERIIRFWLIKYLIGPKRFSAFLGFISGRDAPKWLLRPFLKLYIWKYNIDVSQFDIGVDEVKSFTDFFTRKFKPNQREFKGNLISPAESVLSDYGEIRKNQIVEIKGMGCRLHDFFTSIPENDFHSFAIFYLSPADYHRVHAPFDMEIKRVVYIPGDLYSVKPKSVEKNDTLFCENRKVVLYGNCPFGKFAMILVGALIVGKIVLNFGNRPKSRKYKVEDLQINLSKGEEVGVFELGSTVILLMEKDILKEISVGKGKHVLVGSNLLSSL